MTGGPILPYCLDAMKKKHDDLQLELFKEGIEAPIEVTTGEIHLGKFPVFCISTQKPTDTRATYEETRTLQNGAEIGRRWQVNVDAHLGWPGEHDANVWRAIEHIIHLRGPGTNPFLTSFAEIRRQMGSRGVGSTTWNRIEESLSRLTSVKIRTDFWYHADEEVRKSAEFHLLDGFSVHYRHLANGSKRRSGLTIRVAPQIYTNIVERYVRPLDKGYRDGLRRWVSKRLYEYLSSMFYGVRNKGTVYRTRYTRLCSLFGIKVQPYLSLAKRVLGRAHRELQDKGFLSTVEWYSCPYDNKDWVLTYHPGPVAKAQTQKGHWRVPYNQQTLLFAEELSDVDMVDKVWVEQPDETALVGKLKTDELSDEKASAFNAGLDDEAVLAAFEWATGAPRMMRKFSEAEQILLDEWRNVGVSVEDIKQGVRWAVNREYRMAKSAKRRPNLIWSLDYCARAVWAFFDKRQGEENVSEPITETPKSQPQPKIDLSPQEVEWWGETRRLLQKRLNPRNYKNYIEKLVLIKVQEDQLWLLVPEPFFRDWFDDTYADIVKQVFADVAGKERVSIQYQISNS